MRDGEPLYEQQLNFSVTAPPPTPMSAISQLWFSLAYVLMNDLR